MIETMRRSLAVVALAAAALSGLASAASAADGRSYSEHVRACQSTMGFSGAHNPGVMHRGYSGWHPGHAC